MLTFVLIVPHAITSTLTSRFHEQIIEFKVVQVETPTVWTLFIPYNLVFEDKKKNLSEDELKSQEYDALAFRLVSYGAIPILVGYTIYSLIYEYAVLSSEAACI